MPKTKINYTEAVAELEKILLELENNSEIDMEQVSVKVKRAADLLTICKKQLHEMDGELEKILEELD
ncbi:MAG: exodeoxyribonuclease VII small subunit [Paludibacteraceae bacterium]